MCYTNILQVLDLSGIPLHAAERTEEDPIVIGGGPCTYNPEPLADFFDIFYIGEGETEYFHLMDLYKEYEGKRASPEKNSSMTAAKIPGIYVPSFYEVTYKEDGTIESFAPVQFRYSRCQVEKQIVMDMTDTYYPKKPLSFPLSRPPRTAWCWRSSEAASAAAVSARQACSTVRFERTRS